MVLLERGRQPPRTSQSDLGHVLGIDKSNVALFALAWRRQDTSSRSATPRMGVGASSV